MSKKFTLGMPSKKKRNCPEGDIGTYRREGGKKNPLFLLHQKGDISLWREGSFFLSQVQVQVLSGEFFSGEYISGEYNLGEKKVR